jgi:Rab-GTPase-TBC domain
MSSSITDSITSKSSLVDAALDFDMISIDSKQNSVHSYSSMDEAKFNILNSFANVSRYYKDAVETLGAAQTQRGMLRSQSRELVKEYQNLTASELASIALSYPNRETSAVLNGALLIMTESIDLNTPVGEFELLGSNVCPLPSQRTKADFISEQEWKSYFDTEGRLTASVEHVKERIYKGGSSATIYAEVLPFILGYRRWDKSSIEHQNHRQISKTNFVARKKLWRVSITKKNVEASLLEINLERIEKDVVRTDRNLPFYARETEHSHHEISIKEEIGGSNSLSQLRSILMTYTSSMTNRLEFVQGMADIASPLLNVLRDETDAFCCFSLLMDRIVYLSYTEKEFCTRR